MPGRDHRVVVIGDGFGRLSLTRAMLGSVLVASALLVPDATYLYALFQRRRAGIGARE